VIEGYFTDTVTLCNPTHDQWDRTTWTYTETECRLQRYERTINSNGESILARWKLWLPLSVSSSVTTKTRVYLGNGLVNASPGVSASSLPSQTYQVIESRYEKGFSNSHVEAILG